MENLSEKFLFSEFEQSYTEWRRLIEEGNKRIQFLFTITTLVLAGIGIMIERGIEENSLNLVIIFGLILLIIINLFTFQYLISRRILMDLNTRAIARIRRYFIDKDREILPYITWQTDDSPTAFLKIKGGLLIRLTIAIFSIVITASILFLVNFNQEQSSFTNGIIFISAFVVSSIALYWRARYKIKVQTKKANNQSRFAKIENVTNDFREKDMKLEIKEKKPVPNK